MAGSSQFIVARDGNIIRVRFEREPDPPTPPIPGAGAMRLRGGIETPSDAVSSGIQNLGVARRAPR